MIHYFLTNIFSWLLVTSMHYTFHHTTNIYCLSVSKEPVLETLLIVRYPQFGKWCQTTDYVFSIASKLPQFFSYTTSHTHSISNWYYNLSYMTKSFSMPPKPIPCRKTFALIFFKESNKIQNYLLCDAFGASRPWNVNTQFYSNLIAHTNCTIDKIFIIELLQLRSFVAFELFLSKFSLAWKNEANSRTALLCR